MRSWCSLLMDQSLKRCHMASLKEALPTCPACARSMRPTMALRSSSRTLKLFQRCFSGPGCPRWILQALEEREALNLDPSAKPPLMFVEGCFRSEGPRFSKQVFEDMVSWRSSRRVVVLEVVLVPEVHLVLHAQVEL